MTPECSLSRTEVRGHRLSELVTNTDNRPNNVCLLIVKRLAFKGVPILISPNAYDCDNRLMKDNVAIETSSPDARSLFWKVLHAPEPDALFLANRSFGEPDVSECNWRNKTKMRVRALYWENRAKDVESLGVGTFRVKVIDARKRSAQLLPEGSHLPTVKELRRLVNRVVDKTLAAQSETPATK
jgi:hypothetical protein